MQVLISHHRLGVVRYAKWQQRSNQENKIYSGINVRVCMCVYIYECKEADISSERTSYQTQHKDKGNVQLTWQAIIG